MFRPNLFDIQSNSKLSPNMIIKNVCECSWYNTHVLCIVLDPLHCESLSCTSLTISKNSTIKSHQDGINLKKHVIYAYYFREMRQ